MKAYIRSHILAVLVVGVFVGGILLSQTMGFWSTESRKVARKITTGAFAGKADPADIRGSYTFQDVEKNFGVPVKVLAQAFGFENEKDPASVRAKDLETKFAGSSNTPAGSEPASMAPLESKPQAQTPPPPQSQALEIGTDSLRAFVAFYVGIPYSVKEGTGLPERAFRILKDSQKLSPDQEANLAKIVVKEANIQESLKTPASDTQKPAVSDQSSSSGSTGKATAGTPTSSAAASSGTGKVSGTGKESVTGTSTGAGTGTTSTSTTEPLIKGKTTFKEVLAWGVTKAQIEKVLGRPMPSEGTVIKDWCTKEGLEFGTIRDALQKLKP